MENKTIIAFYRGWSLHPKYLLLDCLIRLFTWCRYSHVELVVGPAQEANKSICWSASARRGGVAVDVKNINLAAWDIVEVQTSTADSVERFKTIESAKYDYLGAILSPFYLVKRSKSRRWYCSEAIFFALTGRRRRLTIKELHKHLTK